MRISPALDRRSTFTVLILAFISLAIAGGEGQATEPPGLKAGFARREVTPPLWVPYLTSSGAGSNAPFEDVHDPLYARAMVLDDGRLPLAVLAVDSIGYDDAVLGAGRNFTAELRRRVAAKTPLAAGSIMLAATHTHSAPETLDISRFREIPRVAGWLEQHLETLVQTVVDAWNARSAVRAYAGHRDVSGVSRYRRIVLAGGGISRNGPLPPAEQVATPWKLDEALNVLYFEGLDGRARGGLLNFTAHPVVAMLLPSVSADYPGAACASVEKALSGAVCLFTNGCAGNVNSARVSTSFDDVEMLGSRLGQAALAEIADLKHSQPLGDTSLAVRSQTVELAPRAAPPLASAEEANRAKPSAASGRVLRLARKLAAGPVRAEVQLMGMGSVRWIGLPGEPFVETGLALKQAGATFVVGYANGYIGYLPIRRAYDEGGYEVDLGAWSRVAPGSAERLESIGESLLKRGRE